MVLVSQMGYSTERKAWTPDGATKGPKEDDLAFSRMGCKKFNSDYVVDNLINSIETEVNQRYLFLLIAKDV